MDETMILQNCITQAEQLKRKIEDYCQVIPNCLGGEMLPVYQQVREYQVILITDIYNQLNIL